jgi:hypothetical protein
MNKKKTTSAIITAGMVIIATLIISPTTPVKKVNKWTCALTGSQKGNIVWLGYFTVSDWYRQSPIEKWLAHNNHQIEHKWVHMQGTGVNIFGRGCSSSSAAEPAALYRFPAELQERFLSTASTEEIKTFLELLKNGDQNKIREAVDQLSEKMMGDM